MSSRGKKRKRSAASGTWPPTTIRGRPATSVRTDTSRPAATGPVNAAGTAATDVEIDVVSDVPSGITVTTSKAAPLRVTNRFTKAVTSAADAPGGSSSTASVRAERAVRRASSPARSSTARRTRAKEVIATATAVTAATRAKVAIRRGRSRATASGRRSVTATREPRACTPRPAPSG